MLGTGMATWKGGRVVGSFYSPQGKRRDAGFSIFYMGINLGALSPVIVGWVGEEVKGRVGLGSVAIGMGIGVVQFLLTAKFLRDGGLHPSSSGDPERDREQRRKGSMAVAACLLTLIVLAILASTGTIVVTARGISDVLGWVLIVIAGTVFCWMILGKGWSTQERKRAGAILVLFVASAIFWAVYEQAESSLSLFPDRNTNRVVLGYEFPASWFQNVQPIFVILLAPLYAWLWIRLGRREPSSPAKFSIGLLFLGLSFLILVPAASGTQVSPNWLTASYFLSVVGELCLSPVGLSAMTKLARARTVGFVMGVWFLSISIGNWLAGRAGSLYESMPLTKLFGLGAATALLTAAVLALLVKPTKRLMSGLS